MTSSPQRPRRVFIEAHELPGLVLGVLRGEPRCLRRVLGARRGGRYGVLFGLAGLALVAPPAHWLAPLALHGLLSAVFGLALQKHVKLGALAYQRLLLWTLGPLLALWAIPRLLVLGYGPGSTAAVLAFAHALHAYHALRLAPAEDAAAERALETSGS